MECSKKREKEEYEISLPTVPVEELKSALKTANWATLTAMIEYLNLDSYELVKNLAKVTNKDNFSNTIAFRDGALSRNESLIKLLKESSKEKTYIDRIKNKQVKVEK